MRFGAILNFHLLWLWALWVPFLIWGYQRKQTLIRQFCGEGRMSALVGPGTLLRQRRRLILLTVAGLAGILALTQPRWGFLWEDVHQEGVDLIVVLDVSNSMRAEDVTPSRIERARHKIADLLGLLAGDRFGLVAFAGTAFVQCPLTLDYSAARLFLNAVDTDLIPVQGTHLGEAIRTATRAFRLQEKTSRAIILITDGEDQEGEGLAAAKEAADLGIKIFTIGIGDPAGSPIPNPEGGFKKDARGEVVLTRLDESGLKSIALATGGSYVRSVTGDLDLKAIYLDHIRKDMAKTELKSERRKIWQERYQWLVFIAFVCLFAETLLSKAPIGSGKKFNENPHATERVDA
ncbi:MAG: hypothetical protein COV67_04280 [Nitrospinae bacterium CG11_big_fil_rev_8_21_14_0_20_56_8]|nr:MAG: hypothetical protein COV67_04280 [Nitrospinae bacterium CG11_big_fil_rev_8_21_14_0_20_56_8]